MPGIVADVTTLANIAGALVADGLQSGTARDTREMLKTASSQFAGRWVWEASKTDLAKAVNIPVTMGPGFNMPAVALQGAVQGGVAYLACMLVGMPRTAARSVIDGLAGAVAEEVAADKLAPSPS